MNYRGVNFDYIPIYTRKEKSRTMKNFIFKSTAADLQKMFQLLETIQKNVLYSTHQLDFLRKQVLGLVHDKDLQTTVDKYFERDETSPQTDQDEQ